MLLSLGSSPGMVLGAFDRTWTFPSNIVLTYLADQTDTFEYIGDIINSALLDIQILDRVIQIESLLVSSFEQVDEFFSQFD